MSGKQALTVSHRGSVFSLLSSQLFEALDPCRSLKRHFISSVHLPLLCLSPSVSALCLWPRVSRRPQGSGLSGVIHPALSAVYAFFCCCYCLASQSPCFGKACVVLYMASLSKLEGVRQSGLRHCKIRYIFTVD